MLGSYGPNPTSEPYIKNFEPEESPAGLLARSGSYNVRSRVIDDDGEVYAGVPQSSVVFGAVLSAHRCPPQIGNGVSNLRRSGEGIPCTYVLLVSVLTQFLVYLFFLRQTEVNVRPMYRFNLNLYLSHCCTRRPVSLRRLGPIFTASRSSWTSPSNNPWKRSLSHEPVPAKSWVDHLPPNVRPYLYLTRIDKPIGTLLLFYPCGSCSLFQGQGRTGNV
jgi:hypothetical protein